MTLLTLPDRFGEAYTGTVLYWYPPEDPQLWHELRKLDYLKSYAPLPHFAEVLLLDMDLREDYCRVLQGHVITRQQRIILKMLETARAEGAGDILVIR